MKLSNFAAYKALVVRLKIRCYGLQLQETEAWKLRQVLVCRAWSECPKGAVEWPVYGRGQGGLNPYLRIVSPKPPKPSRQTLRLASSLAKASLRTMSQSSLRQRSPYRIPAMNVSPAPMVLEEISISSH